MKKLYLFLIIFFIPFYCFALEYPELNSKVVEIYDLNDKKVLYEVKANEKVSIASLTKIATTITAIENIENLQEKVTITNSILSTVSPEASVAGLKDGDVLTYEDLLYASILPSGADATNSIAILSSGSVQEFVKKMNKLAEKIGLYNTHFINVTGLDEEGHYSTADDVRKLLEYALQNEVFKKIYTTKIYTLSNGKVVKTTLFSYNKNNSIDPNIIKGSKTGFTYDAGYCLSSLTFINGHDVIILVLNASKIGNDFYNIKDTLSIIDFMNHNYKDEILINKNETIKEIPVILSNISNYKVLSDKKVVKYLPSDYDKDKFKAVYDGLEKLSFKNHKGDKIGTIKYYYDEELLYTQEVKLDKKINISLIKILKKYYLLIIIVISLFIFIFIRLNWKKKKQRRK